MNGTFLLQEPFQAIYTSWRIDEVGMEGYLQPIGYGE